MCGRFTYKLTWPEIVKLYRPSLDAPARNTQPRYNICPTTTIDTVIGREGARAGGEHRLVGSLIGRSCFRVRIKKAPLSGAFVGTSRPNVCTWWKRTCGVLKGGSCPNSAAVGPYFTKRLIVLCSDE